jgi:predicted Zn-dependent protease
MVYGSNPREGYFRDQLFLHPDMRFQIAFPPDWMTANQKSAVLAQSPNKDAIMQLTLADAGSPAAAARDFVAQEGVTGGPVQGGNIHGFPAAAAEFTAQSETTALRGSVTFVEYDGNLYQLLAYSTSNAWAGYVDVIRGSVMSFDRLTDQAALSAQPMRLRIIPLDRAMTLDEFNRRYPSSVSLETLAILNQVEANTRMAAGTLVKRVTGNPPQ